LCLPCTVAAVQLDTYTYKDFVKYSNTLKVDLERQAFLGELLMSFGPTISATTKTQRISVTLKQLSKNCFNSQTLTGASFISNMMESLAAKEDLKRLFTFLAAQDLQAAKQARKTIGASIAVTATVPFHLP